MIILNEKIKEKSIVSSLCKSNYMLNHGETDSYLGENEEIINCSINFVFRPEIKGKKMNCYFNLEELMNVLEEEIKSVSGDYISKVNIEEFYNAEREGSEKNNPPEIIYSIKNPYSNKDLQPIRISSPKKEILDKIFYLIKDTELIHYIEYLGEEIPENKLKQKLLTDTTYKYFQTRSVFHNKSFIDEIVDTLNEIAEKDYEELENILL